jgi:hypothetical protein
VISGARRPKAKKFFREAGRKFFREAEGQKVF